MSGNNPVTAYEYHKRQQIAKKKRQFILLPPEGVSINLELASLSSRFSAQFLDIVFTYGLVILLIMQTGLSSSFDWDTTLVFFVLLAFLARVPYYILTELVWNGRTLAKRIIKIRVISMNGQRLEPYQVVVRNLLKEVEVFLPISLLAGIMNSTGGLRFLLFIWLIIVLSIPFFSKNNQRLGDMIAGTCVIEQPKVELSSELTTTTSKMSEKFEFIPSHLEFYGRFELQTLETILRQNVDDKKAIERYAEVVDAITRKIGFIGPIKATEHKEFLVAFYTEQRAHLEKKQLFGEIRESKHHREA